MYKVASQLDSEFKMIEELKDTEIKVLLFLYRRPEGVTLQDIVQNCKMSWGTVYRVISTLNRFKLVNERRIGIARLFTLSENGRWVAERLKEIDEKLSEIVKGA